MISGEERKKDEKSFKSVCRIRKQIAKYMYQRKIEENGAKMYLKE